MTGIWILGGAQTDFARNWTKEGLDSADMFAEVVPATLTSAGVSAADIGVIHVGNAFGQLLTGQGHLGGMAATVDPGLWGVPAARHEAACASGGIAILAAMADLESGRYDAALVVGMELEKAVTGDEVARQMRAASWVGHEGESVAYVWPWTFDAIADEYDRRFGMDDAHLRAIGELNFGNARRNPNAQTRDWRLNPESFTADDVVNPVVHGRLRRQDCSQVTDGAAGLVLVTDAFLAENPILAARPRVRVAGWGHRTVGLPLARKLATSAGDRYVLPHVRGTILDAFGRAGIPDVTAIDGIETHDCFTPSEYLAIDHFGITEPGMSWQAIEAGELELTGRIPMNPSGGLIGGGHPVGATGVRMVLDAHRQVTGTAGDYQVEGAQSFATLNIGGSTTTTVAFVIAAEDR
jgi:acetyl-CoA C-acetyltransferase